MTYEEKDQLNHRAYRDVINGKEPFLPDNAYYMENYYFWSHVEEELERM
jgi:acid phosphatase class B